MTQGRVVIVGGGPGAPDLITVRGLQRLQEADLVVHDRLAPLALLDGLDAEIVDASRTPEGRTISQDEIHERLIRAAKDGKVAVRLKGGDPLVLAHGIEELDACVAAGVPVEIVPGVTSATAAAGLVGVPLTAKDGAAGFTVLSGHDPDALDWPALVQSRTSLVLLMATRKLGVIADRLIAAGADPRAATTVVADASLPTQRHVTGPLAEIVGQAAGLGNPAVVIVPPSRPRQRVLVLGGSGSGKSAFAESLLTGDCEYVATGLSNDGDAEWTARIARHRERRPQHWTTTETLDPASVVATDGPPVLIDSITTWVGTDPDPEPLLAALQHTDRHVVMVSDEVGNSVVPETAAGRQFRDDLGRLNQRLAAVADEVWLVTAGIPQRLKPSGRVG